MIEKASQVSSQPGQASSYKSAGVDTRKASRALTPLFDSLHKTWGARGHVKLELGHFANVVDLGPFGVAISTDGVGTKTVIAQLMRSYESIGVDCVAVNANDVLCVGAEPVSMVDYLAVRWADEEMIAQIGEGLRRGAEQAGISIVGGETAQLPELIHGEQGENGFDLAGTCIGTVDLDKIVTGARINPGDAVLGLRSSGIHCNGLTLARKAFGLTQDTSTKRKVQLLNEHFSELGSTLGEELSKPSRIYVAEVMHMLEEGLGVRGLAHITSDGFLNLSRLESGVGYLIDRLPEPQPIFGLIQTLGAVPDEEMHEVFNMGIGFCVVLPESDVDRALEIAGGHGSEAFRIGYVVEDETRAVTLVGPGLRGRRSKGFQKAS